MRPPLQILLIVIAAMLAACAHTSSPRPQHSAPAADLTGDAGRGRAVYDAQCAACHGRGGTGGPIGPSLQNERLRHSHDAIRSAIVNPEPPMPKLFPARMSAADVHDVTAYVETL